MDQFLFRKITSTPKQQDQCSAEDTDEGLGTDGQSTADNSLFLNLDETHEHQVSDSSGIETSSSDADMVPSEHSMYFSALNSRIEELGKKAQDLIEKLNESRKENDELMNNFQDKIMMKVESLCQQMKDHMCEVYEEDNMLVEEKLQQLSESLQRSRLLNMELHGASQSLRTINKCLCFPTDL